MRDTIKKIRTIKQEGNIGLMELAYMLGYQGELNKAEEIIYGKPEISEKEGNAMLNRLVSSIEKEKDDLKKEIDFRTERLTDLENRYENLCGIDLNIVDKEEK